MHAPQPPRPPDRVPVIVLANGVLFPHTPRRTIYFKAMPSLVAKLRETKFCIVAFVIRQLSVMPSTGTLAYVRKIGILRDSNAVIVVPVERVKIRELRIERDGDESFYFSAMERIQEEPLSPAYWEHCEQERKLLLRLFANYLREIQNRVHYFEATQRKNPGTQKLLTIISQSRDIFPQLEQATPQSFGAVLDRISDATSRVYLSFALTPKFEFILLIARLLTLTGHAERFHQLVSLLLGFVENIDQALAPEIESVFHYTEEHIAAMVSPELKFPIANLFGPN